MSRLASVLALVLIVSSSACASSSPEPEDTAVQPNAEPEPEAAAAEPVVADALFEGDDGRYGYKSEAGEIVIEAKFMMATEFEDQVAAVVDDQGWAFINRQGATLARAFVFDNGADEWAQGRARIVAGEGADRRYGFISTTGEIAVAPTWAFAKPFSGGFAAVCEGCVESQDGEHSIMTGGKWGYIDLEGTVVIPARFGDAGPFEDGKASVTIAGKPATIGPDGSVVPN